MYSLYKRGAVWWAAFTGGDRVSTKSKDREAAERWAKLEERRRADPAHAAAQATTIDDGVKALLAERAERGKSPSTVRYYKQKLGHLCRLLGNDAPLASLTAASIAAFVSERKAELASEAEMSKELGALRAMLRLMWRRELYPHDPRKVLPVISSAYEPRDRWLTPAEADALVDALETGEAPERAGPVAFALATAARLSEVFRAERGDWDEAAGLVRVRGTKTKKSAGLVPVMPGPWRDMLEVALRHGAPAGRLFAHWPNHRRGILDACEAAGVPPVSWNDLRRSHTKWLRLAGVEPALLGEVLRHEPGSTMAARVYGRLSPEQLRAQLEERMRPRG